MSVTIYHNPSCGTSRNTLAMIRQSGEEPEVIEYLKTPPSRARLVELIKAMGVPVRALLREKGTPYAELGLADPKWSDDELIDFMLAHPILINRPIVVTQGRPPVPAVGAGARSARQSRRLVREGGRRSRLPAQNKVSGGALPTGAFARHNRAHGTEFPPELDELAGPPGSGKPARKRSAPRLLRALLRRGNPDFARPRRHRHAAPEF